MSLPMLRRAILDLRWMVLWYGLGIGLYALVIIQFWPVVREQTELMQQYLKAFPAGLMEAFGVTDLTTFAGFLGAELLNFMWPLIASVFVIMAGTAVVAQEIDRGTVELWLSVPEARWRLLAAKLTALFLGVAAVAGLTALGIAAAVALVGEEATVPGLLSLTVVLMSFGVAVAGYSALFSTLFRERGKAAGMAAAITVASYLASVIAGLSKDWEAARNLSLWTAFHPQVALESGAPVWSEVGVLIAIGTASALAALLVFERKDAAP